MHEPYFALLNESGLWRGQRADTHFFHLSPDVYPVCRDQQALLVKLGAAIPVVFAAMSQLITEADQKRSEQRWNPFLYAAQKGIPRPFYPLQVMQPDSIPQLCKVDLMEDEHNQYRIAEIDGTNERGMGYSTLTAKLRKLSQPDATTFPGCARLLAELVRSRDKQSLILLYPEQERFYRPEFEVLQSALAEQGVQLDLVIEGDYLGLENALQQQGATALFMHLGHMYRDELMFWLLSRAYEEGDVEFLIPPKLWTSSKAVLALLRNDIGNPFVEQKLGETITKWALSLMRDLIPETYLVESTPEFLRLFPKGKPVEGFVLKACYASGMKGTIFTDDPRFPKAFDEALRTNGNYVLQRVVTNAAKQYRFFDRDKNLQEATWYQRVVTHFNRGHVADVTVTGRQDKCVHGAPDCIQIGAVCL